MEFLEMELEKYDDFDAYVTAYRNATRTLKQYDVGLVRDDEDICFQFNKGLPQAWNTHKGISSAATHTFEQAVSYYRKMAKSDSSLPGVLKAKTSKAKAVYATHNFNLKEDSEETCRLFARGQCSRGDNCRYKHVEQPNQTGGNGSQTRPQGKFNGKCNYCSKLGHKESMCFKKKRDEGSKGNGADSSHATHGHATSQQEEQKLDTDGTVSLDGVAYMVTDQEVSPQATFITSKTMLKLEKHTGAALQCAKARRCSWCSTEPALWPWCKTKASALRSRTSASSSRQEVKASQPWYTARVKGCFPST